MILLKCVIFRDNECHTGPSPNLAKCHTGPSPEHSGGYMAPLLAEKDFEAPTVNIQKVFTSKNLVTGKFFKYLLLQLVSNLLEMPQVHPLQTSPRFWFWEPFSLLQPANWMQILSNKSIFAPKIFLLQLWPQFSALPTYRNKIQRLQDSLKIQK